jgi:hypothetical protein
MEPRPRTMDIYARLTKPFTPSLSTAVFQTDDGEALLTGTNFHWFSQSANHFKVETSDGLFEFQMKRMKPPRKGLLARLLGAGLYKQATAAGASSGKQIRITQRRLELIVEDLDTGTTVIGRDETPRRLLATRRHVLRSSLGNSITIEEQPPRVRDVKEMLVGPKGIKIGAFGGERAEDWNLLLVALFAYHTMLMPLYEIDD